MSGRPRRTEVIVRRALVLALPLSVLSAVPGTVRAGAAQPADTVLRLDEALDLLAAHNPDYRAALANADAAGQGMWQAWGAFLPTVAASASFSRSGFTKRTFVDPVGVSQELDDPITNTSKFVNQSLSLNWEAFDGGRRLFDLRAQRARTNAAHLSASATRVRLAAELKDRYFEALKQQRLAELARELVAARERDLEVARARFEIAAVSQTDVLQAEIEVGSQELAALNAGRAAAAARRELAALIGLEQAIDFRLEDTVAVFDPAGVELDGLLRRARTAHPDLARLDAEVEAERRGLWAARGSWLPSVRLGLTFSRSEALGARGDFLTLDPRDTGTNLNLTFSWPILQGFRKKYETGQAAARLSAARHQRQAARLSVETDVRNAYDALAAAHRAVEIQTRNADLARESVRLATERYRLGAIGYFELQQATDRATQAERGLIEARYEFMKARARLEAAVAAEIGRPGDDGAS